MTQSADAALFGEDPASEIAELERQIELTEGEKYAAVLSLVKVG
jgi:hypothetical protein